MGIEPLAVLRPLYGEAAFLGAGDWRCCDHGDLCSTHRCHNAGWDKSPGYSPLREGFHNTGCGVDRCLDNTLLFLTFGLLDLEFFLLALVLGLHLLDGLGVLFFGHQPGIESGLQLFFLGVLVLLVLFEFGVLLGRHHFVVTGV